MGFLPMEKGLAFIVMLSCVFCQNLLSQSSYNDKQKRIDEIKREIEIKSKEYDDYVRKYNEISEMIKKLKETERDYYIKKNEYEKILSNLREKIDENRKQYNLLTQRQNDLLEEANLEIRKLYFSRFSSPFFYGRKEMILDMIRRNIIIEKKRFLDAIENKKKIFKQSIFDLTRKNEVVKKEKEKTETMLSKSRRDIEKKQSELYITDAKLKKLKDEIELLNRTAKDLTAFIRNIERRSPYKKEKDLSVDIERRSLPWPVLGKVISKFGREYVEDLKTWLINDGIKIQTSSQTPVKPVMPGKVAYSGKFRGYGDIVLIDHGNGIFTTYGFLSDVYVKNGDDVNESTVIGKVGRDLRSLNDDTSYVLYFEIRKGDTPLDPLIYLK